ncbi:hypothetical protein [Variovorax sp. YR216]|uniref:hypothetical protein n=1 Tax=Variovorax sp. YR216 TaxID=1882828 RepID=UPI000B8443AA|nr:hypothetical protein [Variovorax sp. YR216]
MLIAAAGWYAIGSHQGVPAPAMPANPVVVPPPAPVPEPASPAPEPPTVISEPELAPEPRSVLAEPATPAKQLAAPRVRKPAVAPPAAPSAPAEAQAPAPAPAPEAAPPANPQALCGGLNFISRARCMAAQCAKPEFTAHPQCDAVRRQQQIEEEKRNPSLLN